MQNIKNTKALIEEAVNAGIKAGVAHAISNVKDAFKATERRLYALPILKKKVEADKVRLADFSEKGLKFHSAYIMRFKRTGYRVPAEDMLDAIIQDLQAGIAADENEIETLEQVLRVFEDDPFFPTVIGRYIERYEDEDIAVDLNCGITQVWKQRTRIVRDIAVMLYGSIAI